MAVGPCEGIIPELMSYLCLPTECPSAFQLIINTVCVVLVHLHVFVCVETNIGQCFIQSKDWSTVCSTPHPLPGYNRAGEHICQQY